MQLLLRWLVLAIGVVLAAKLVPGIHYTDGVTLIVVVVLLSFFNAILKPLLVLFTLPFIVMTLGLGMILINALLFLFVGTLVSGFYVEGFWSAVGGSLIVSFTNFILSRVLRASPRRPGPPAPPPPARRKDDGGDVIDI
ncbi:phage holin family protein [Horticoccus luteus]|uniref:Phage holin family protein n=1 Tax=Horticoccus luteus TaxID=2862869 RepID=A0A8F9XML7_9BACT|nr:phage holin family protein [Horticoccus luteus]QYM80169.1 phage holin family protein [Horticoccus luteus]